MQKKSKEKHFIKKPTYEGGLKALRLFIQTHLQYPKTALNKQIEGTALVEYTVNYKGEVIQAKIIKGPGHGCNEEAIRLVKLLKFKIAKTRKIKIRFHKSIQIHFKLPKEKNQTISYNYTSAKKKAATEETNSNPGYNYTINLG